MPGGDQQVKQGLTNFVGTLLRSSKLENREARQKVNAILLEESLRLCRNEKGVYDLIIAKPLLKAVVLLLKQRLSRLKTVSKENYDATETYMEKYKVIIKDIEEIISILK